MGALGPAPTRVTKGATKKEEKEKGKEERKGKMRGLPFKHKQGLQGRKLLGYQIDPLGVGVGE